MKINTKEIAKSAHALIEKMVRAEQLVIDNFDYDETRLHEIGAIGELNRNIAEAVADVVSTVKEADHSYELIENFGSLNQFYPLYASIAICYEIGHYTEFHEIQTVSKDVTNMYYHMINSDGSIDYKQTSVDLSYMTGLIFLLLCNYFAGIDIIDRNHFFYMIIKDLDEIYGRWFEQTRLMWVIPQLETDPCPVCGCLMDEIDRKEDPPTWDDPGSVTITWKCTVCDEIFED